MVVRRDGPDVGRGSRMAVYRDAPAGCQGSPFVGCILMHRRPPWPSGLWAWTWLLAVLLLLLATPTHAQPPSGWSVGAAAVVSGKPYGDADYDVMPVPFFGYEGERFFFRGLALGWRLPDAGPVSTELLARARMQSFSASDDPVLEGMDSRRRTAEGGVRFSAGPRWLRLEASVYQELLGRHDGQVLEARVSVPFPAGRWIVIPAVGVDWQSADMTAYYYGVRDSEATEERPAYSPGASLNRTVGLGLRYRGAERAGVIVQVNREFFGGTLRESPIVEGGGRWSGIVGLSWRL